MKYIKIVIAAIVVLLGASWIFQSNDFFLYKFWAPKQENVRRQVFENTQSYTEGKIQNISEECRDFHRVDGAQKEAFASEIRNEASTIDINKLPPDEQSCVAAAREQ